MGSCGVAPGSRLPPHSLSRCCRVMLDSVTHSSAFLPNTSFCDPLMSWTDLFSNEEYYPTFEHQTGAYIWRSPSELTWAGAESGAGLGRVTSTCWGAANASSHQCSVQRARGGLGGRQGSSCREDSTGTLTLTPSCLCSLGRLC